MSTRSGVVLLCLAACVLCSARQALSPHDDPRWIMRDAVNAYLQEIQAARESRISARLEQGRLQSQFVAFAAQLCTPTSSTRLRSLASVGQLSSDIIEKRKLRLEAHDLWTQEEGADRLIQQWIITEHEYVLRSGISLVRRYAWQAKELAQLFEGRPDGRGSYRVRPLWSDDHRLEERLPPQLVRLVNLLSPDTHLLLMTALADGR